MNYTKLRAVNKILLVKERSNEDGLTFVDYYMFHLSSFALSLYRENIINQEEQKNNYTLSNVFMLRSIIEDLAILTYYEQEQPLNAEELLKDYWAIAEYQIYKDYQEYDDLVFNLSDMKMNYDKVKEKYEAIYKEWNLNSRERGKKLTSIVPFLKNGYSISRFIDEYKTNYSSIYKLLSIIVHPISITFKYDRLKLDLNQLIKDIYIEIDTLMEKYYHSIEEKSDCSFICEYSNYYKSGSQINPHILNGYTQIAFLDGTKIRIDKILKKYSNEVKIHNSMLDKIIELLRSISIDRAFGFSEMIKSKFKAFSELCATYYYLLIHAREGKLVEYSLLIDYYTKYQIYKNVEINNRIISVYSEMIALISLVDFKEKLSKELPVFLGYNSIREFVFQFFDKTLGGNSSLAKILYEESQAFSHGNGYLLSTTDGAFNDYKSVIQIEDIIIEKIFFYLEESQKKRNSRDTLQTKKIFNDINYREIIKEKWLFDGILDKTGEKIN